VTEEWQIIVNLTKTTTTTTKTTTINVLVKINAALSLIFAQTALQTPPPLITPCHQPHEAV